MNRFIVYDGKQQMCSYCWKNKVTFQNWCSRLHYFLERSKDIHGEKYDYSKFVYTGATKPGIIICKTHGEFKQSPNTHYRGCECQKCALINSGNNRKKELAFFIKKAQTVHKNFYDYSLFVYNGYGKKGIIICPKHGEFKQGFDSHLRGSGCPKCKGDKIKSALCLGLDKFIQRAQKIHNNKYDYSKVEYVNVETAVLILCPNHGEFFQRPHSHLDGRGCTKCSNTHSKQCIESLETVMKKENIHIQHAANGGEYCLPETRYKLDGYCKETDTAYEFYGDYWHGNPNIFKPDYLNKRSGLTMGELYQRTLNRENIVKNKVSKLITMWENDWDLKKIFSINK